MPFYERLYIVTYGSLPSISPNFKVKKNQRSTNRGAQRIRISTAESVLAHKSETDFIMLAVSHMQNPFIYYLGCYKTVHFS